MKYSLVATLLFFMTQALYADIIVIGPDIRNGDFESGVTSPWQDCYLVSNASFAAQGNCCVETRPDVWRAGIWQFFPAASTAMPNFTLSFQLRNGSPPYTVFSCSLNARRHDGSWFTSSRVYLSNPPPSTEGWCTQACVFTFTEMWDESFDMQLHIGWNGGDTNTIGYLDDVRLTQISDPTSIRDISAADGSVTLTIQHYAVSNSFSIQRCFDLADDTWGSVSNLILTAPGVQWSEDASNQWDKVFYRLKKE